MASQTQIRKALAQLPNVAAFVKRYAKPLGIAERTIYRQRLDDPPDMREHVKEKLELALIREGLLHAPKPPKAKPPAKRDRTPA